MEKRHQVVLNAGGLHILGTERHESRRIDNKEVGQAGKEIQVIQSFSYPWKMTY